MIMSHYFYDLTHFRGRNTKIFAFVFWFKWKLQNLLSRLIDLYQLSYSFCEIVLLSLKFTKPAPVSWKLHNKSTAVVQNWTAMAPKISNMQRLEKEKLQLCQLWSLKVSNGHKNELCSMNKTKTNSSPGVYFEYD